MSAQLRRHCRRTRSGPRRSARYRQKRASTPYSAPSQPLTCVANENTSISRQTASHTSHRRFHRLSRAASIRLTRCTRSQSWV